MNVRWSLTEIDGFGGASWVGWDGVAASVCDGLGLSLLVTRVFGEPGLMFFWGLLAGVGFGRLEEWRVVVSAGAALLEAHAGAVSRVAAGSSGGVGVSLETASVWGGLRGLRRVAG